MLRVKMQNKYVGLYLLAFFSGALLIQLWYAQPHFPQGVGIKDSQPDLVYEAHDVIGQKDLVMKNLMGPNIRYDNPELLNVLKEYFIDTKRPYITKVSFPLYQTPQAAAVDKILGHKKNGYFVECGALDGERSSNTIWLELKRGWTGLLVEMDPSYYLQIRGKNRKVHSMNACLSPKNYTTQINFQEDMKGSGKLLQDQTKESAAIHKTYCFPLVSVMLALGVTHIDYLSLDVEGAEFDILRTIPFDKLDITVLSVEYAHVKDRNKITEFMGKRGYSLKETISVTRLEINLYAEDYIFAKE